MDTVTDRWLWVMASERGLLIELVVWNLPIQQGWSAVKIGLMSFTA